MLIKFWCSTRLWELSQHWHFYFARRIGGEVLWWTRLSVCLSDRISPEPHARSLPIFCARCLWPWLGVPPARWRNPKAKGQFGFFSPHWQCIVTRSLKITSCSSRTDHSFAAGEWWECTARGWSMIYDCLVNFCTKKLNVIQLLMTKGSSILILPVPVGIVSRPTSTLPETSRQTSSSSF